VRETAAVTASPGGRARVAALARACHPEPTVAVTAVAVTLAIATGRDAPGVLAVGAAVLAGQLSIGWSNDYLDRARDASTGRRDKPLVGSPVQARTVGASALLAAALAVPLSLLSGLPGLLHLGTVASGWAYNLGLKASPLSVLPYALAFGLLPAFVVAGLPGQSAVPPWLVAAGALLGAGAHFANALPDLDDDRRTGVVGLPHRLGVGASGLAAALLLLAASLVLTLGPAGPPGPLELAGLATAAAVLAAGLLAGQRFGSRAAFRAVLLVAAVDVALLLASGAALG